MNFCEGEVKMRLCESQSKVKWKWVACEVNVKKRLYESEVKWMRKYSEVYVKLD